MPEIPTPIADLVRELLSLGQSADIVVMAVAGAERAAAIAARPRGGSSETDDMRRERDRLRKARYRAGVRGLSHSLENALLLSSGLSTGNTTVISKKEKKERFDVSADVPRDKKAKGIVLPDGWAPNDEHFAVGEQNGYTRSDVMRAATEMRDWALANAHRREARKAGVKGWDATFRNWIKRNAQRRRPPAKQSTNLFEEALSLAERRR